MDGAGKRLFCTRRGEIGGGLLGAGPLVAEDARELVHQRGQPVARAARAVAGRKIGPGEERAPLVIEEDGHRPAAVSAEQLDRLHVHAVDVGPLLAVELDANELLVEQPGDLLVLERLLFHHVAPVAGGVADGEEDGQVARARFGEGLVAPRPPVDRVVRVLEQVRALLEGQPVRVLCTRRGDEVARARGSVAARDRGGELRGEFRSERRGAGAWKRDHI